ncbi:50S ribosomal protein L25 [bacterium]|nr:50S ribosomal protein L25 [bacterium]
MVKELKLAVKLRSEKNGKPRKMRESGIIPAVLYGLGKENINLKIVKLEFERLYEQAGESTIFDLEIDGKDKVKVIIKEMQMDTIKDRILHVDFYRIDMKKPIDVEIPLVFVGEPKAVSDLGGTLIKNIEAIEIKSLPDNLPENFELDLTVLETFNDAIRVKDIKIPEGVEITRNPEDLIASVLEPRIVEEEKPAEDETEEGESKEGDKKEEGESKEGDKKEEGDKKKEGKPEKK